MAELSDNTNWFEVDASNVQPPPAGWPAGMQPNQVEPTEQAAMGALKRFWNRANGIVTTTGSAGAYVYTTANPTYPTAYVNGEGFRLKAHQSSNGGDTFQVNSLAALPIYNPRAQGILPIRARDIEVGSFPLFIYDATIPGFVMVDGFTLYGDYLEADTGASQISLSNGIPTNLVSLSLTPGDWDVEGSVNHGIAGVTGPVNVFGWSSAASATGPVTLLQSFRNGVAVSEANVFLTIVKQRYVVAPSTTLTVFLEGQANWISGAGPVHSIGRIFARRIKS